MFNLQTLIDEAVIKNNQVKSGGRDASYFHVSDAGTCYRKRYYKRLGIAPTTEIDAPALRKMLAGDAGHEKLQFILKRNGNLMASEGEVKTKHILGHFDAIVKNGVKTLLEIKTTEKFQIGYIKKTGAKPEHKLQMFTYWSLLRKDYSDLDNAILSYVKREDFEAHDYYFNWSDEIQAQVDNEWKPLIKFWESGELPPCTCSVDYGGNGVKYCRYPSDELNCCDEVLYTQFEKQNQSPRVMTN